jgi:hypothetical protein
MFLVKGPRMNLLDRAQQRLMALATCDESRIGDGDRSVGLDEPIFQTGDSSRGEVQSFCGNCA